MTDAVTTTVTEPRPSTTLDRPEKSHRRKSPTRPHLGLYLFPLPAVALYAVFFVLPTVQAFRYAVTDWDGFSGDYRNVGLGNFTSLATNDDLFHNAVGNTLKFMLVVVIAQTIVALLLGLLLLRNSAASTALRALFFFPTVLSSIAVAFVWGFVYDPKGAGNQVLGYLGLHQNFLGDPHRAIFWVAVAQVWFHAGQMMVIFIAGLQQIPVELNEAASLDGVTRWQRFRYLTWPMLLPTTLVVLAYTIVQSFKAFDIIVGLSGGSNVPESLDILSTRIFITIQNSQYGMAAAESIVFMATIALVTVLQRRVTRWTTR